MELLLWGKQPLAADCGPNEQDSDHDLEKEGITGNLPTIIVLLGNPDTFLLISAMAHDPILVDQSHEEGSCYRRCGFVGSHTADALLAKGYSVQVFDNPPGADWGAVNVGTGNPVSIQEIAEQIAGMLDLDIEPKVSGTYRAGDIRLVMPISPESNEILGTHRTLH